MAGIYIHIPFCKQRCSYCDFYTRVAPLQIEKTVNAIVREIELRKDYLDNESISTIYFGGGTPSLLLPVHFEQIFNQIYRFFEVDKRAEITFEANPDDLTINFFNSIAHLPFNRISMGIQTFDDKQLKQISRRHTGHEAVEAFHNARKAGFGNISVDLIYGLPEQTIENWLQQLNKAIKLHPEHISVYGLTYEPGTPLFKQRELGKVNPVADENMNKMHIAALEILRNAGYEGYEISNYALKGFRSQHNSAYWQGKKYLGIGPSAHSFDGDSRQWNIASIKDYLQAIESNKPFYETEILSNQEKYNEYIMVRLRTMEGANLTDIQEKFGDKYASSFQETAIKHLRSKHIIQAQNHYYLSTAGVLISNSIIEDFILVD